jgi:DNA-binding transcriptional ArsR family regulator
MSPLSDRAITRLTEIFRILGDPTRVRILDALAGQERSVGDLAAGLGVTHSAVSHQLRLLRGARIVRPRRSGRLVYYALDDPHVLALYQEGLRHALEDRREAGR